MHMILILTTARMHPGEMSNYILFSKHNITIFFTASSSYFCCFARGARLAIGPVVLDLAHRHILMTALMSKPNQTLEHVQDRHHGVA